MTFTDKKKILHTLAITIILLISIFTPIMASLKADISNELKDNNLVIQKNDNINLEEEKTIKIRFLNLLDKILEHFPFFEKFLSRQIFDKLNNKDEKNQNVNLMSSPSWPTSWILIDTDPAENGIVDDYRDVQYVYYNTDGNYIYLRQECYGAAGWTYGDARYKFWFDFDCNAYLSGGNVVEGEYLFFVEDIDDDNIGEIYLLEDTDNDGMYSEWEQPPNYYSSGLITNTNIADYRIIGNNVDLYLDLNEIGYPYDTCLVWATDQENPNLDQAPNTDRPDGWDIPIDPIPIINPEIEINKQADSNLVILGDTITYTYTVTNTGDVNLTGITVNDNMLGTVTLNNTDLEPGQWAIGTSTYVVTTSDLPGPIVNTATATGTDPVGGTVTDSDTEYVAIDYNPEINLDKQADTNTANIGDTITYTYTVTNTGNTILVSIIVNDDMLGSISLGTTTLSPGQSTTGTATYVVVEADLPGPIENTATATGTPPSGPDVTDTDNQIVTIQYTPGITIDKSADINTANIGDTITYTFTVTNTGDVILTGVSVVDDMLGGVTLGSTTLTPGGSTSGTATYVVVEGDLPGPIVNTGTATGTDPLGDPVSDSDTESVTIIINPAIEIDKEADVSSAGIGDTITYTFTVTNTGDVTLTGVSVVDDMLGGITLGSTTLTPGQSTTGTATYVVVEGDLPGPIVNTGTATGTDPLGDPVSDSDSESVSIEFVPSIELYKEADVSSAGIGDTITYTFTVTNTGDVILTGVSVVDDMLGGITLGSTTLTPGQSTTGTATYVVVEGDLPGPIVNTATASGTPPTGSDVTDTATESVSITYTACIDVDKEADVESAGIGDTITYTFTVTNCGDVTLTGVSVVDDMLGGITLGSTTLTPGQSTTGTATYIISEGDLPGPIVNTGTSTGTDPLGDPVSDSDTESVSITYTACIDVDKEADVESAGIGDTITYTFTVTNCGDVTLTGVSVVDDMLGGITLGSTTLTPGQSTTGTATYIISEGDLPGPIMNTATASGTDPVGDSVSDSDTESVSITYTACIDVDKEADVESAGIGDTITYTFTVTNCGDVTLTGVSVVDDMLGGITLGSTTLTPGQSTTGTATYIISEGDLPGPIMNTATASGTDPVGDSVSDSDAESVSITYTACIDVDKEADVSSAGIGDTITYTFTVTNTGDVTLTGVSVVDDMLGGITLGSTTLIPGGSTSGTATYVVVEGDLPGPIVNTGTASGTDPVGDPVSDSDTESVTIIINPAIEIDKEADVSSAGIGDTITYTFTVTNTGDVTLTGVSVVDDMLGGVTLGSTTLTPGQSTSGTATYVVVEGDLPGPIVNTGTASGTPPMGSDVTDMDSESVTIEIVPSIELDKEADVSAVKVGDTITYTFTVTNTGDVTLTGVSVVDDMLGGITLGSTTLTSGQTTSGTSTLNTDCEHIGYIINTAVATGTDPLGGTVFDSDSESVLVYVNPGIEIEKEVQNPLTGQWVDHLDTYVGYDLTFHIHISNIGDVPLNNVELIDNLPIILNYNYDANPPASSESNNQIIWNLGTLNINEDIDIYFSANVIDDGNGPNIAIASGIFCYEVNDQDETPITAIPCAEEVWVDDDWNNQYDVDQYDPSLTWLVDAFNNIQLAVNVLCNCGTVHVLNGEYYEQILINKDLHLLGEEDAKIILPNIVNSYTIEGSTESWVPIIFAYGGNLIGNDVNGPGNIAVMIDGFEFDGRNYTDSVAILYHNVESGCAPAIISNNTIAKIDIGIKIDGCSDDTTIIHNRIRWAKRTFGKTGMVITESGGCEPDNVEIHYNYLGIPCGLNKGIWNQVSIIVEATYNWWGEDDGPSSPRNADTYDAITGRIADGFGDQVIGLVHFDPWWGVEASGEVYPTNALVGELIHFDASDSFAYDIDGAIPEEDIQYKWKYDDGYYSFSKHSTHIYDSPGTYKITLSIRVIDYNLEEVYGFLYDFAYFTVYISEPGAPLIANSDPNNLGGYESIVNNPIQFYGSATGGTTPYYYKWTFGDGESSNEQNPKHTYVNTGTYTATLTVNDNEGNIASDTSSVTIYLNELIADAGGPYTGYIGEDITFKGSATGGLEPYIFIWDFGDGSNPVQIQNPTYRYNEANTYNVKLTVIDSEGNSDDNEVGAIIIEDEENKVEVKDIKGGLGVKATLITGSNPISWSIDIDGRFVFGGKSSSGIVHADSTEVIRTPLLIGLGNINIIIKADTVTEERNAFMIGPFVFLEKNQI